MTSINAQSESQIGLGDNVRGRIAGVVADVGRSNDIQRVFDETMKTFGKVDIVVNNAGVLRIGAFEALTDELMQEDLDQKLFAAIRLTRLAWPQLKERRWGRVLNVLSIGARAPGGGSAPTSISRAAGLALTKVLAGEGAPFNVLVNALLVGFIESDQHARSAVRASVPYPEHIASAGKTSRSAGSAPRPNLPTSRVSWRPMQHHTSPVPQSTSTAVCRRWPRTSGARQTRYTAACASSAMASRAAARQKSSDPG